MALFQPGTWKALGPIGSMDFGITEALGIGNKNPAVIQGGAAAYNKPYLDINVGSALGAKTQAPIAGPTYYGPQTSQQTTQQTSGDGQINQGGGDSGGGSIDPYAGLRNEISSGWDQYVNSLDNQLSSLSNQRSAQENIAQSQFNQGRNTLGLQKEQILGQLGRERETAQQNQQKTLRDLSENIRNAFQAGNVYLGSMGAGDSSAANQYSYALTKVGNQGRSDVMQNTSNIMADIGARETDLSNAYNTNLNNLQESFNQQMNQIASWFADAQRQIQQAKSQGAFGKSQDLSNLSKDILNQAMSRINALQDQANTARQQLDSWAANQLGLINQAKAQFQNIGATNYQMPTAPQINGAPQMTASGGIYAPIGYGNDNERQNSLFQMAR